MNAISQKTDMAAPAVSEPSPPVEPADASAPHAAACAAAADPRAARAADRRRLFLCHGARYVSTDNAYVKADIAAVSAEISGRVVAVTVADNDHVTAGQLLFQIDPQPFRARAGPGRGAAAEHARRHPGARRRAYRQKQAEIVMAAGERRLLRARARHLEKMAKSKIAAQTQLDEARHNLTTSRQQLPALQQELAASSPSSAARPTCRRSSIRAISRPRRRGTRRRWTCSARRSARPPTASSPT